MKIRPALVLLSILCASSTAFARKDIDPKDYTEGKLIEVTKEQIATGILSGMQGATAGEIKYTYVIECSEGTYEAREFHATNSIVKPLQVYTGGTVMFRVNSKGRLMYVPVQKGEKALEVMKFRPKVQTAKAE